MKIEKIYEDSDMVAINKPAGLVVHGDGKREEYTLVNWILENYPEIESVGEPPIVLRSKEDGEDSDSEERIVPKTIIRPGIVHRLDRDTSGVLVIAKNQKAHEYLKKQFQDRLAEKTYHAFLYGELKNDDGVIDKPIGRSTSDFRKKSVDKRAKGEMRDAVTFYSVLKRDNGFSLVEAMPKTGRTHQIRVHFTSISNPIVGDKLYAPKKALALGFDRLALHSFRLRIKDIKGKDLEIIAPYPEDFQKAVDSFGSLDS